MKSSSWENHYQREKSQLSYPDENLVRLLRKIQKKRKSVSHIRAVDLGCGSGRHLNLLNEIGIENIIGTDSSLKGLTISRENSSFPLIQMDNKHISLKDNSVDLLIAWGSLHYSHKDELPFMISEINRVLKKNGQLIGTLRSDKDTYMKRGKHIQNNIWQTDLDDIKGAIVSFFKEDELKSYFDIFNKFNYGFIERSIIGDMDKIISHWVIHCQK